MSIFSRWFGGRSRKQVALEAAAAADAARAKRAAEAALVNPSDSENARLAQEARLKKLGRRRGLAGTDLGGSRGGAALLGG